MNFERRSAVNSIGPVGIYLSTPMNSCCYALFLLKILQSRNLNHIKLTGEQNSEQMVLQLPAPPPLASALMDCHKKCPYKSFVPFFKGPQPNPLYFSNAAKECENQMLTAHKGTCTFKSFFHKLINFILCHL